MDIEGLKVLLSILGGSFIFYQWHKQQRWQQAAKFDELVKYFNENEHIILACQAVDWTQRVVPAVTPGAAGPSQLVSFASEEVVNALDVNHVTTISANEVRLRDAFDYFLGFFGRLQRAIESELVDSDWARDSFSYYLERFLCMERHLNALALRGKDRTIAAAYIAKYGDRRAFRRLINRWNLEVPLETLRVLNA